MAPSSRSRSYDVVVVGGGPAGAVAAWSLARRGVRVAVLERSRFPRDKVCGDFIEPRGLRLFEAMGCMPGLEASARLPITHVAMFLQSRCAYRGPIPFYGHEEGLPPHGYIVPRRELDQHLIDCACRAGAVLEEACSATGIEREGDRLTVWATRRGRRVGFSARLVVGADGNDSVVARESGLLRYDQRYIAVAQRAYAEGVAEGNGEARFFFDDDLFPGYGWVFPMAGGTANIGVGILSEARARNDISVPKLFRGFADRLREQQPDFQSMRIVGKPVGGIVKTYGGSGPNYFDGGILVGDAGCFVDPMTGEGITPAAESALIGSSVVAEALAQGRSDAAFLSRYEREFRRYFDPAMDYLDLCAAVMRNRHLRDFWLTTVARGCEKAAKDPAFARTAGAAFGGLEVKPLSIGTRIWLKVVEELLAEGPRTAVALLEGRPDEASRWLQGMSAWNLGWWRSMLADPVWHSTWWADVLQKWIRVLGDVGRSNDIRAQVPLLSLLPRRPGAGHASSALL